MAEARPPELGSRRLRRESPLRQQGRWHAKGRTPQQCRVLRKWVQQLECGAQNVRKQAQVLRCRLHMLPITERHWKLWHSGAPTICALEHLRWSICLIGCRARRGRKKWVRTHLRHPVTRHGGQRSVPSLRHCIQPCIEKPDAAHQLGIAMLSRGRADVALAGSAGTRRWGR